MKSLVEVLVDQWCLALCDPMDCSPPGSSVHGISQARILEWAAISFSRGPSQPRDQTSNLWVSCIGRQILYSWAPGKLDRWVINHVKILWRESFSPPILILSWRGSFPAPLCQLELQPLDAELGKDAQWCHASFPPDKQAISRAIAKCRETTRKLWVLSICFKLYRCCKIYVKLTTWAIKCPIQGH